jgi:hypothetical protein
MLLVRSVLTTTFVPLQTTKEHLNIVNIHNSKAYKHDIMKLAHPKKSN